MRVVIWLKKGEKKIDVALSRRVASSRRRWAEVGNKYE